jgi:hypothetical protein
MRAIPIVLLLSLSAPALAQTPDTTSAWRYLPLEVGNVWEYEVYEETCDVDGSCSDALLTGYVQRAVVGEILVEGRLYVEVLERRFSSEKEVTSSNQRLVRFDTLAARPVWRNDAVDEAWPGFFSCRLDTPFGADAVCSEIPLSTTGGYEEPIVIDDDVFVGTVKSYVSSVGRYDFVADVGIVETIFGGGAPAFTVWHEASYVRVGDAEYGTRRFAVPVASESAPVASELALAVFPNPSRGAVTARLSLDRPQRVALAVYDVLGRRVLARDLGVQAAGATNHRLDLGGLPVGVYVVRLDGDAGARATARVVRQ